MRTAADLVFEALGPRRALLGLSDEQLILDGLRLAAAAESTPILDVRDVGWRIRRALELHRPLSLIRMGDGEALVMAQGAVLTPEQVLERGPFLVHTGVAVPDYRARRELLEAFERADLVGIPLSRAENFQPLFAEVLADAGLRPDPSRLTHSLVNYELWKQGVIQPLLPGRRVLLVGGPAASFAAILASHGVAVAGLVAPVNGIGDVGAAVERCRTFDFDLALVSAGVAACLICPRVSAACGAVALDFGACADEVVQGEPWHEDRTGLADDLLAAECERVVTTRHGAPSPVQWHQDLLQRTAATEVVRIEARWERHGLCRRWSLIGKTFAASERASWEAAMLGVIRHQTDFRVPEAYWSDERHLLLSDLAGTPLATASRIWWRQAARGLATYHTRSRGLLAVLPQRRRLHWDRLLACTSCAVETACASAAQLGPRRRAVLEALQAAWFERPDDAPAMADRVLAHGDFRPTNLLAPDELGVPVAVVDWESAAEQTPAYDLAMLATHLRPADRDLLIDDYLLARRAAGWPASRSEFLHDFCLAGRLQLSRTLADLLRDEAQTGPQAGADEVEAVAWRLRSLRTQPPR